MSNLVEYGRQERESASRSASLAAANWFMEELSNELRKALSKETRKVILRLMNKVQDAQDELRKGPIREL